MRALEAALERHRDTGERYFLPVRIQVDESGVQARTLDKGMPVALTAGEVAQARRWLEISP